MLLGGVLLIIIIMDTRMHVAMCINILYKLSSDSDAELIVTV